MIIYMRLNSWQLSVLVIVLLAALLRFYGLGQVPHGMTWDEAAIGYNGSAILRTRRDEWLQRLPISFRSFGDYKAPLAIYTNGLFTAVFGMNLTAVRIPFAMAGVATVWGVILLTRLGLDQLGVKRVKELSLVAGLLVALSPWHIHFSRAGFESGLATSLLIWGSLAAFKYSQLSKQKSKTAFLMAIVTVSLWLGAIYSYHSAKVVVPLIGLIWLVSSWRSLFKYPLPLLLATVVGLIGIRPLAMDALYANGLERMGTLVFDNYQGPVLIWTILKNLGLHLSPVFLIGGAVTTLRHGDGVWGVLLPTTYMLVLVGVWIGIRSIISLRRKHRVLLSRQRVIWFFLAASWIVVGLLPAAMGEEIPHQNRALLALPGFIWLALLGLDALLTWIRKLSINRQLRGSHGETGLVLKSFIGTLILLHGLFFVGYIKHYFTVFARDSADDFKDGYIKAFEYVVALEKGSDTKPAVDKIVFTSDYGQPYIYALFVRKTNPIWYQGGSLIKYEFTDNITVGDLQRKNAVVVASQTDELPESEADTIIYGSDGSVRFKIYVTE